MAVDISPSNVVVEQIDINLLKPHPRNVEIYGDEDVRDLQQSISESGWIKPLTVNPEHVVISGHRRYHAAKALGYTEIPVVVETFATPESEMERLLRENENRGKTPEQQIREGMTWEPIEKAKAEEREKRGNTSYPPKNFSEGGEVRNIIARRVGLGSGVTYEKGKAVVERIDRELRHDDTFRYGDILRTQLNEQSITAAWNTLDKIVKAEEKAEQEQKRKEEEQLRQQEEARQRYLEAMKKAEHCTLYHCSVADLSQHVKSESIDCIICDPPYPREYLSVYSDLAQFAQYSLKPGGSLVVMTGQSYIQEIMERLASTGLAYQWMCAYLTPGGQSPQLWERNVNSFWKPLLWYVKGEYTGEWIGDVCKSDVNQNDKSKHEWGQSESGMADIIRRFTKTNQLICDPFVGGGATCMVSIEMERRFVGCDIDETCVKASSEKVKQSLGVSIDD